jgi:hypothetical protein
MRMPIELVWPRTPSPLPLAGEVASHRMMRCGWGNSLHLDGMTRGGPHPSPPPQAGEGASFRPARLRLTKANRGSVGPDRRWSARPGGGMRQRKNSASFSILVQIQAGPPAFAASRLRLGWPATGLPRTKPSHAAVLRRKRACRAVARRAKAGKMPVDGVVKTLSRLRNLV